MFKQPITRTLFSSEEADKHFPDIQANPYESDITFVSTLRALLTPRMKEGDHIGVYYTGSSYRAEITSSNSEEDVIRAHYDNSWGNGSILIHSLCHSNDEHNKKLLEFIKGHFTKIYPEWVALEKVTDFYRKSFTVLCFINYRQKKVFLALDKLNLSKLHYLQCSILAFLPWYFNPEDGVSEEEMALINSLREKTSDSYEACISRIAERYDFRTLRIRRLLYGIESKYVENECVKTKDRIRSYINNIASYNEVIRGELKKKYEDETKLMGLEARKSNAEESEIMDYFLRNKNLILEYANGERLDFIAITYLEYFDEEGLSSILENKNSYVYKPGGSSQHGSILSDDMARLMKEIFINQTLKIRVCAAYRLDLPAGNVLALSGYAFPAECGRCIPNPHINQYQCMGDYSCTINELLLNNDYIGAIEQCVASAKSLNFFDNIVMDEFMKELYGTSEYRRNNKCIELPDGSIVDPAGAIAWLKTEEVNTDEQNN